MARSIARPALRMMPWLKKGMLQVASKTAAPPERPRFNADEARVSLERSLSELRTDRIDVWLLHEATVQDLTDESLLRFLEDAVTAGKIGTYGVGSERTRAEALMSEQPEYCPVVQFEWSVMDAPVTPSRSFRMHHRALTANFRALHSAIAGDRGRAARWSHEVGVDLHDSGRLAALMLKAALEEHPESVILFSSKSPAHMRANVRTADDAALAAPARKLYALVQRESSGAMRNAMAVTG